MNMLQKWMPSGRGVQGVQRLLHALFPHDKDFIVRRPLQVGVKQEENQEFREVAEKSFSCHDVNVVNVKLKCDKQ